MGQLDLNDVALFVRVVDRAGFAKVARELRVPTSTVSRAITRLETTLGARLFMRSTRSVVPTAEGHAFYREVSPAVASLHHAARGIDGADRKPRGRLRITAPNDIGASFLGEVVANFTSRYPNIEVQTLLTARTVNLVEEGVDAALRAAPRLPDSSLVARKVGSLEQDLYASLSYVQSAGLPAAPEDLLTHALVTFRPREGRAAWHLVDSRDGSTTNLDVMGHIGTDDYSFMRATLLAGGGIGLIPRIVVQGDIESGKLVRVLPHHAAVGDSLFFVHAATPVVPAKVALFRDFVIDTLARRGLQ